MQTLFCYFAYLLESDSQWRETSHTSFWCLETQIAILLLGLPKVSIHILLTLLAAEFVPNCHGVTMFDFDILQLEEFADEKLIFHIYHLSMNISFPSNVDVRIIYKS